MLPLPISERSGRSAGCPGGQWALWKIGTGRDHGESFMNSVSMHRENRTIYATATSSESLCVCSLTLNLNSG